MQREHTHTPPVCNSQKAAMPMKWACQHKVLLSARNVAEPDPRRVTLCQPEPQRDSKRQHLQIQQQGNNSQELPGKEGWLRAIPALPTRLFQPLPHLLSLHPPGAAHATAALLAGQAGIPASGRRQHSRMCPVDRSDTWRKLFVRPKKMLQSKTVREEAGFQTNTPAQNLYKQLWNLASPQVWAPVVQLWQQCQQLRRVPAVLSSSLHPRPTESIISATCPERG